MVAITVILAAVIGTFVLGLGSSIQQQTPQAQFGFEVSDDNDDDDVDTVTVTHESGDSIPTSELSLRAASESGSWPGSGDVTAGDSATVTDDEATSNGALDLSSGVELSGKTVRVVWASPGGDNTATLGKFDVPS